jgi:hypothetical protein
MRVILQILCQIQSPSSGLRYVDCGPGHIQCIYSSAYSDFYVHLNESALLLEISRQFNARYTANLVPNTAHILRVTLCVLWSRTYTMHLQLRTFRLQYSSERICAAIVHITTIQCALYCKLVAKYNAHPPVYALWTVVPAIYKVLTAPHIQALVFNSRQVPWYWRNLGNSMRVILHSWCQIQRTSSSFRYVNSGSARIQCIYSSAYSILNIRLNVSALLLEICLYLHACYTANFVPNTEPNLRFALCQLSSRPYTKYFQHRIFRLQYSAVAICAPIVHITTIQCALYCKLVAKYSALPPVYTIWTVVPTISKVLTAPHI